MAELKFWQNGSKGSEVKEIIETNFKNINAQLGQVASPYVQTFTVSDWKNGAIFIDYSAYSRQNPCIDLFVKNGNAYSFVYGGYEIKNNGIELQSDIAYDGKVVIR